MTRFDDIDLVDVPDQWAEIVQRAESAPVVDLAPARRGRLWEVGAVAASVLVIAGAAALAFDRDDSTTEVATTAPGVDDTTSPMPDPIDHGATPVLACTGGELRAGSIPADAVVGGDPIFDLEQFQGLRPSVSWSWRVGDLDVQLVVPGIPWVDFVGERTEALVDPPGTLAYMRDESGQRPTANAIVETGLPEPCARAEVIVAGGTEAERVAAATHAARALSWRPLVSSPGPDDVEDESSVRQWALGKAAEQLGGGVHLVEVSISEYRSDDRIGRMVGGLEGREPERAWSVILRTAPGALIHRGDPQEIGRGLLTMNFGAESQDWTMASGVSGPADRAMRDPVPALVIGAVVVDDHERMLELQQELERRERERAREQRELGEEQFREEQAD